MKRTAAAAIETGAISQELVAAYLTGFSNLDEEHDYWVQPDMVEGTIPRELQGTWYRNGPGRIETPMGRVSQPFHADGMVVSIAFRQGSAFFRNKHITGDDYVARQVCSRFV